MPSPTVNLAITEQERSALSAALETMLKLWGDSEGATQERIRNKLRSIATKLEALKQSNGKQTPPVKPGPRSTSRANRSLR